MHSTHAWLAQKWCNYNLSGLFSGQCQHCFVLMTKTNFVDTQEFPRLLPQERCPGSRWNPTGTLPWISPAMLDGPCTPRRTRSSFSAPSRPLGHSKSFATPKEDYVQICSPSGTCKYTYILGFC